MKCCPSWLLPWLSALLLAAPAVAHAQEGPWQVFRERSNAGNTVGQDTITFLDLVSGEQQTVAVFGDRYTALPDSILFYDRVENRVFTAMPDGTVREHPFIQPGPTTRRVDWVVSDDFRRIAWTLTEGTSTESLVTNTTIANLDGTASRIILQDGPRNGIRALPVAFSEDNSTLYMDYQPDTLGEFTPFDEYAGLFAVSLKEGQAVQMLPGEPGCFCGADIHAGWFVRLAISEGLSGFDVRTHDLSNQANETLPALDLDTYTQAGDVLISSDGGKAVYALASVQNVGTPEQTSRVRLALVDLLTLQQEILTDPLPITVRPVAWTENNTGILLTAVDRDGTWKVELRDGRLDQVATATYIATLDAAIQ